VIINGRARGRSAQLAAHLLRRDQNEDIRLYELRGVTATDVAGALAEMEALTAAVPSKRPLYHASISPEAHRPLNDGQVRVAADTLERKLGLAGQPRAIVLHRKSGREHVHVVWSRLDLGRQRVISDSWSYAAHEEAARELEAAFGHRTVPGAFAPVPRRAHRDYEYRQAERSGKSPAEVSAELAALWRGSSDAARFKRKLEEAGYILARGDRRVFVVIDRAGNAHSLARRLGMPTRDLRTRLGTVDLDVLPSVNDARAALSQPAPPNPLRPH
jgi:Relaxase/Mobilisation nuclease domain